MGTRTIARLSLTDTVSTAMKGASQQTSSTRWRRCGPSTCVRTPLRCCLVVLFHFLSSRSIRGAETEPTHDNDAPRIDFSGLLETLDNSSSSAGGEGQSSNAASGDNNHNAHGGEDSDRSSGRKGGARSDKHASPSPVLPPEMKDKIRAYLQQVHSVDLRRRIRELILFHYTHEVHGSASASPREQSNIDLTEEQYFKFAANRQAASSPPNAAPPQNQQRRRRREPVDAGGARPRPRSTLDATQPAALKRMLGRRKALPGSYGELVHRALHGERPTEAPRELSSLDVPGANGYQHRGAGARKLLQGSPPGSLQSVFENFPFQQLSRDYYDPADVGRGFGGAWIQEAILRKIEAEFCMVPAASDIAGSNFCVEERGYGCVQQEVNPTDWVGAELKIKFDGWLCRLVTEELAQDYEVLDVAARVECIPPRVRYEYLPARFRKKYVHRWQFQSPECKKVYCRNLLFDNPFIGTTLGGVDDELGITNLRGGSWKDKLPPWFISGDECLADIKELIWKAGSDLVWIVS